MMIKLLSLLYLNFFFFFLIFNNKFNATTTKKKNSYLFFSIGIFKMKNYNKEFKLCKQCFIFL